MSKANEKLRRLRQAFLDVYWNHRLNKLWHHDNCMVRTLHDDVNAPDRCDCGYSQFKAAIDDEVKK